MKVDKINLEGLVSRPSEKIPQRRFDDELDKHIFEMDMCIAEKLMHEMKVDRELAKHGHLVKKK